MRTFRHLTFSARLKLEAMYRAGMGATAIAKALRVHVSTIYRELKRGSYQRLTSDYIFQTQYSPEIAHEKYRANLAAKGPALKIGNDVAYARYLEDLMLRSRMSPAAALAIARADTEHCFNTTVSVNTVYSYIDKGLFLHLTNKYLPTRGKKKRRYHHVQPARPPKGDSIEYRPKAIDLRSQFGHWEMDTVVGRKGTLPTLLVLTERQTRHEIIVPMKDRTTASVVAALDTIERRYGKLFPKVFRTITVDNGSEFQDCEGIERSIRRKGKRTQLFFCHPYSAWERGSNECLNRMIRRCLPKGTNFGKVSKGTIRKIQDWMNNYPRAILGWATAAQAFQAQLQALG